MDNRKLTINQAVVHYLLKVKKMSRKDIAWEMNLSATRVRELIMKCERKLRMYPTINKEFIKNNHVRGLKNA